MSQLTMTIIDPSRAVHEQPHGSFADVVVAALSAEPETLEELEAALARFLEPDRSDHFAHWSAGVSEEPYDAGICIVDLTARLVVLQSTYSSPGSDGEVKCYNAKSDKDVWTAYHLSDDWLFSTNLDGWQGLAEQRCAARAANPPLDTRRALYGKVCEFIVGECFEARGNTSESGNWTPPEGWSLRALPERISENAKPTPADAVAEIHGRWMLAPREDLGNRSPRDVLLVRKSHIDWDLQDRCIQWSMTGRCPPGLNPRSAAFRLAGFGTHENVLYYELLRHLVWDCWDRVVEPTPGKAADALDQADEVERLGRVKDEWLDTPGLEDLSGHAPAVVIGRERMRLPMAVSGEEAAVDPDCPLCQMMAEDMGPMFWNLDGCNMDQDFPFSFRRTREEWEEERRKWEEFNRKFEEEEKLRKAGSAPTDDLPYSDADESTSVWKHSFSDPDVENQAPQIVLFGIGGHLAELGSDLKTSPDTESSAALLNRQFGNLRAAISEPSAALVEPVVQRFCEELHSVSEVRPDLAEKCEDLERQLSQFATLLLEEDDLPF